MAQQLKNITIAAPGFAGINTQDSPISVGTEFCLIAENAIIDQFGRIGARKGYEVQTTDNTALGSAPLQGIFEFLDTDGTVTTVSTGNNKVFTGETTLTDITPVAATITADNWKGVTFNGNLFLFQDSQDPIYYDGTTCDLVENHPNYSGTVPTGNEVIAGYGRLWAVNPAKTTIYWSDLLNGFAWDTGSSGSINVNKVWADQSDEIQALATHNGYLVIFGKRQILIYQGPQDPATMSLADSITGVGCIARDSLQSTGQDLIFLADSGVRSFNRVIQEKSLPMRDISKNVRSDLMNLALIQSAPIKSAYSEDEAFYLISFPTSNAIYCFDMRGQLQNGSHRATLWTGITPRAFCTKRDGTLLFGDNDGISEYKGYNDNGNTYQFRYFSSYLDFQAQSNLKFLKKLNITIIGGQNTQATLNWGYDYTSAYIREVFNFASSNLAEYGIAEYNTSEAEYNASVVIQEPRVNTSGSGTVVQIGLEAQINNAPFSIQKIDIHALVGRIV